MDDDDDDDVASEFIGCTLGRCEPGVRICFARQPPSAGLWLVIGWWQA